MEKHPSNVNKYKYINIFFFRTPNCHRILLFGESPGEPRRINGKKGDNRITASKSFDDGLDEDNLDNSKIVSALKYSSFLNTVESILSNLEHFQLVLLTVMISIYI
jgi:hypothetical protein